MSAAVREIARAPVRCAASTLADVLIVDDSIVARSVIGRYVEESRRARVVGAVSCAEAALAFLRTQRVDVILLDIAMPGRDGLAALPDLLGAAAGAKVLVISSAVGVGAAATLQALALGAADTLVKPASGEPSRRFGTALIEKLTTLAEAQPGHLPVATGLPLRHEYDVVAIGASTGGIYALGQLLQAIPASVETPILITQHLPASFTPVFARQVAAMAGRPCDVGEDRLRIRPSRVIVAPGTAHLRCVRTTDGAAIRLSTRPAISGCTPSVDPMFESVAETFGARALGVVLSGMGRDGSEGARRLTACGAGVVVQDRESSTVWGMPGSVAALGCARAILPPAQIGELIASGGRAA